MPTFILGVGAQKSGTTWLHHYLKRSFSNVDMGAKKEYNYWNNFFNPRPQRFFYKNTPFLLEMLKQPSNYDNYFKNLIRGDITITGDISPEYCTLKSCDYDIIRNRLENIGFNVKIVFLIRDPVDRCWSSAHHAHRENFWNSAGTLNNKEVDVLAYFRKTYRQRSYTQYTDYMRTITEIEKSFSKENIHIPIYEEIFTDGTALKKLSDFCGVECNLLYRTEKFNVGKNYDVALDNQTSMKVYNFYKSVYDYCNDRFPQTKTLWKSY